MRFQFSICYWEDDWESVPKLCDDIRSLFPDALITLVPDGLTPLPTPTGTSTIRLKAIDGGAWLSRILGTCSNECDLFFKVEPDVTFRRVFNVPDAEWFGHLAKPYGAARPLLRGGCWGLKRESLQRLLDSRILLDKAYLNDCYKYDRSGRFLLSGEKSGSMVYHCDTIMASAMNRLGILPTNWNEIYLSFRESLPPSIERYAISTIGR